MMIQYVSNGSKRDVRESIGNVLIDRKLARPVYETRMLEPEPAVESTEPDIKPKRKYKRRDLQSEE